MGTEQERRHLPVHGAVLTSRLTFGAALQRYGAREITDQLSDAFGSRANEHQTKLANALTSKLAEGVLAVDPLTKEHVQAAQIALSVYEQQNGRAPLNVDGNQGDSVFANTLSQYQRENQLSQSGALDAPTLQSLMNFVSEITADPGKQR